jgi:predicted N-acetyltransferase YhbS
MRIQPFDPEDVHHAAAVAAIWNQACGADLAVSPAFVAFNTRPATGGVQAGRLAMAGEGVAGFVLTSALPGDPATSPPEEGWIDAVAVAPAFQRRGIGSGLLAWAEAWLAEQGCARARLGGSLRPFAAGLPLELDSEAFFRARGYRPRASAGTVWDLVRDLTGYLEDIQLPAPSPSSATQIAMARPSDEESLQGFLQREFPGRWRFDFQEFRRVGGMMSEFNLLWRQESGRAAYVDGFCRIRRRWRYGVEPLDRYFMHRLPTPWGQLGPIGVGLKSRGQGLGAALIDFGLRRLRSYRVRGCVIDWTTLLDYYGRFGFKPFRAYRVLLKNVRGTLP